MLSSTSSRGCCAHPLLFDLGEFVKARTSIERFIELRARTASFEDPDILKAYDFIERCDRAIATSNQG